MPLSYTADCPAVSPANACSAGGVGAGFACGVGAGVASGVGAGGACRGVSNRASCSSGVAGGSRTGVSGTVSEIATEETTRCALPFNPFAVPSSPMTRVSPLH